MIDQGTNSIVRRVESIRGSNAIAIRTVRTRAIVGFHRNTLPTTEANRSAEYRYEATMRLQPLPLPRCAWNLSSQPSLLRALTIGATLTVWKEFPDPERGMRERRNRRMMVRNRGSILSAFMANDELRSHEFPECFAFSRMQMSLITSHAPKSTTD